MKAITRLVLVALLSVFSVLSVSCASSGQPKKTKPVPPGANDSSSNLPWNRPRGFESNSGLGRMMPQSR